jgi:hypothetical protein
MFISRRPRFAVVWVLFHDVSKESTSLTFKELEPFFFDASTLKDEAMSYFETSSNCNTATQRHIPEDMNTQQYRWGEKKPYFERNAFIPPLQRFVSKASQIMTFHFVVCLTTGPHPLPKPVLHRVRSSAFPFNFPYPVFSLRPFSSCLRRLLCLPVISIPPFIFPSIRCTRKQFLRKTWQIQLAFLSFCCM